MTFYYTHVHNTDKISTIDRTRASEFDTNSSSTIVANLLYANKTLSGTFQENIDQKSE